MRLASKAEYLYNCITNYVDAKVDYEIARNNKDLNDYMGPSSRLLDKTETELQECLNEIFQEKE